jgi:hypothetical protein
MMHIHRNKSYPKSSVIVSLCIEIKLSLAKNCLMIFWIHHISMSITVVLDVVQKLMEIKRKYEG